MNHQQILPKHERGLPFGNKRAIQIGLQAYGFRGVEVHNSHHHGICLILECPPSTEIEPHEARALGEALIAAADDVAAYKVKP